MITFISNWRSTSMWIHWWVSLLLFPVEIEIKKLLILHQVASLQQSQDIEEICEETEMKIQLNDFTFSTPQPQLTVYVYIGFSYIKRIEVREPTINLSNLKPKTSYTIKARKSNNLKIDFKKVNICRWLIDQHIGTIMF